MANLFATNDLHLTVVDPEIENARRMTVAGMAHFAGTGPGVTTCRECTHWTGCGKQSGYTARKGMSGGELKPRACAKFRSMMRGEIGGEIPHYTSSCKYFERASNPPTMFEKR